MAARKIETAKTFRRFPRWSGLEIGLTFAILLAVALLAMYRGRAALNADDYRHGALALAVLSACAVGMAGFAKAIRRDRDFRGLELVGSTLSAVYATRPPVEFDVPSSLHQVLIGEQGNAPGLVLREGRKEVVIKPSEFEGEEDLTKLLDELISPNKRDPGSPRSVPRLSQFRPRNVIRFRMTIAIVIAVFAAAVSIWSPLFVARIRDPMERWLVFLAVSVGALSIWSIWQAWKQGSPRQ